MVRHRCGRVNLNALSFVANHDASRADAGNKKARTHEVCGLCW
jgi:hypothetical protein